MTQYDVELFQKIEQLTGKKMEEYQTEEEAVLLLLERVSEAQRMATMAIKEADSGKKGGKRGGGDDDDDLGGGRKKRKKY